MVPATRLLLLDANVLIDYRESDFSILSLANIYLGKVHILTPILAEVGDLDAGKREESNLTIIEPELEHVFSAAERKGRLSFNDSLCLIVAAAGGYTCATNDKALRGACAETGVPVVWGLEIMAELVRCHAMTAEAAVAVAEKIHSVNPHHIPLRLIDRFRRTVTQVTGETKKV
ncbi:MAG TPA: type II toxin-antitoxin system VapC family toxin [Candidatus Aminicenantes bacterium]|nr:type II toxin-antitoxin system VapC family toxin [Candidatus Aminicenantes bacterium]